MNRTKKFLYNSLTMALYEIVLLISGIIIPRVILKFYGSELNGLITSITQFITYFNLVEAGLAGASIYALYKPLAEENYGMINSIVVATKNFYNKSGRIFIVLIFSLAIIYPFCVNNSVLNKFSVFLLILILGTRTILEFFTLGKYRAVLSADQRAYIISISSIIYQVLYTIIVVVLSYCKVNIIIVYFFSIIAICARSIILIIYSKRKYSYIDYTAKPRYDLLDKRYDALYLQILGAVQKGAPILIITFIVQDLKIVSVYAVFNIIISGINNVLGIFTSGLGASFGNIIAKKEEEILKNTYNQFETTYYALITIVYTVCYVMIMPFIKLYTEGITDINYNIPVIGILFTLNGLLYNLKTPQGMLVISAGMYKETRWRNTIQAMIIVIIGILLSFKFKLIGVLIAICLSNLYRDIDLLLFVPKYITHSSWRSSIKKIFEMILSIIIIILPFQFVEINTLNYIEWIGVASIVTIYSLIITLTINVIFERQDIKNVITRLSRLVKNFKRSK